MRNLIRLVPFAAGALLCAEPPEWDAALAKARQAFGIPDELDLVTVIVLGWPGAPDDLPEHLQQRERARSPRRELSELVHHGRFVP